jgi:hypothetical protein
VTYGSFQKYRRKTHYDSKSRDDRVLHILAMSSLTSQPTFTMSAYSPWFYRFWSQLFLPPFALLVCILSVFLLTSNLVFWILWKNLRITYVMIYSLTVISPQKSFQPSLILMCTQNFYQYNSPVAESCHMQLQRFTTNVPSRPLMQGRKSCCLLSSYCVGLGNPGREAISKKGPLLALNIRAQRTDKNNKNCSLVFNFIFINSSWICTKPIVVRGNATAAARPWAHSYFETG